MYFIHTLIEGTPLFWGVAVGLRGVSVFVLNHFQWEITLKMI